MNPFKLLVVEDDDLMRSMLLDALQALPVIVTMAVDGDEGWAQFQRLRPDLILLDLKLPKRDGLQLLRDMKAMDAQILVMMMTAYGTIEAAVEAMKSGAYDFITKPFLAEELAILVQRAVGYLSLQSENRALRAELKTRCAPRELVGKSAVIEELERLIEVAAKSDSTVLITGESGTGKEVVAEALHRRSPRHRKPLIRVSCAALPETLLESELFGHEKGAFTDAGKRRTGRFEAAKGGTIFLDDVDDMTPLVQMKLLRVLQEKTIERVGGSETLHVDVRVIAATKVDLREAVALGRFRDDLFYRLNVVPVNLPPLRQRREDVPLLVEHFIEKYGRAMQRRVRFTAEATEMLIGYAWPGNIRELENLVERFVAISSEQIIDVAQLPQEMQRTLAWRPGPLKDRVVQAEYQHIQRVLEYTGGRKKEAAELMGITPKTLWQKLKMMDDN